ncbi:hypothetical protein PULV_a3986 [Pseudoalteromonas ulvae UL12]|uniref:TauD/TfdA family dioxygenase n=1 Tax=Pseudoalteromonas ulvae TaxID=107327 RepID=UPI0019F44BC1|nr:TauD/TfdA family dioxygenase [Pseudoalteromonas ulvae]MBE0362178.1 hypothetical protein [Pseudoalteromonas ulvae UL12]
MTELVEMRPLEKAVTSNEIYALSPSELECILDVLNNVSAEYCVDHFEEFFWHCVRASQMLPAAIHKRIFDLKKLQVNHLLLRNLPVSFDLGDTPLKRSGQHQKSALTARKLMSVLLSQIGLIYGFTQKSNFDFIDDVFPVEKDKHEQLGTNKEFLEWHVEDGFHDAKADWVSLFCLRSDPMAQTYLFHAKDIDLDSKYMAALKRPEYMIEVDKTFKSNGASEQKVAVLSEHDDPEIVYDPAYMRCLTDEAKAAFRELHYFVSENKQSITLRCGDLLIFDNRRTIHARSEYEPRYDGTDRWLLRALLLESQFKAREHFDSFLKVS